MPRPSSRPSSSRAPAPAAKSAPVVRPRGVAQQVRIIGGEWKRTPLAVIDARGLRPTPDRVRETLFNWLGQDLSGWRCIDAFAGSGALGFEAASRGAASVTLIERDARAAEQLRAVKAKLAAQSVQILEADASRLLSSMAPGVADVIFLDPPFDSPLLPSALRAAAHLCAPHGAIYVESAVPLIPLPPRKKGRSPDAGEPMGDAAVAAAQALRDAWAALAAAGWEVVRQAAAGAVHYHLLRRSNAPAPDA